MLTITVNDAAFKDDLARLYARLGNLSAPMNAIGMELENRTRARFETRTDPLGQSWAAWKPSTVETYPEDGHRKLLDRYGDMLRSLSHQADSTSVKVGFGQPYATYMEFGTKHMPRRGLLFANPESATLSPSDETAVLDILGDFLASSAGA